MPDDPTGITQHQARLAQQSFRSGYELMVRQCLTSMDPTLAVDTLSYEACLRRLQDVCQQLLEQMSVPVASAEHSPDPSATEKHGEGHPSG